MSKSSFSDIQDSSNINENGDELPENRKNIYEVFESERIYESPIDINISNVIPVNTAPQLSWIHFDQPPKKIKITNTGHTVILSAKWGQERPYISNGVLTGKYVFSQIHLHWGVNDMEGSEHTIDGVQYPGEMHVVLFKSCYLTQEAALKEKDGVSVLVYILKLQDADNPKFNSIINALPEIAKAHSSAKIPPAPLSDLLNEFTSDYFIYRGSVVTTSCIHEIFWLITRIPIAVSLNQMDSLRYLLDNNDDIIRRNFRPVQPASNRHIFHILPSTSKYSTLLNNPIDDLGEKTITQIYRVQILYNEHNMKERKAITKENVKLTDDSLSNQAIFVVSNSSKYTDYIYYIVLRFLLGVMLNV